MNARVKPPAVGEARPAEAPKETKAEASKNAAVENTNETTPPAPRKRRGRRLAIMLAVPVVLLVGGGYFWLTGGRYEGTDNAYVQQTIVSLSPDISGRIVEVDVHENQTVQMGAVLFRIDPEPFKIALNQAEASLAAARLNVEQLRVSYQMAEEQLKAAQDTLEIRQRAQQRTTSLADKGFSTQAATDNSLLALQQAQAAVDTAQKSVAAAKAALGGDPKIATEDHPSVRAARAAVESAQRNLDKTTVTAPTEGVVSQVSNLNTGQFVSAGSTIASLVDTSSSWIEANYKETQLGSIKVGQPADIHIDAYPAANLHGTVSSIGAATGSEFSLIPAQNATGNWVKVVQRIPVRIDLTDAPDLALRSGMSAEVTVDTGKSRLDGFK